MGVASCPLTNQQLHAEWEDTPQDPLLRNWKQIGAWEEVGVAFEDVGMAVCEVGMAFEEVGVATNLTSLCCSSNPPGSSVTLCGRPRPLSRPLLAQRCAKFTTSSWPTRRTPSPAPSDVIRDKAQEHAVMWRYFAPCEQISSFTPKRSSERFFKSTNWIWIKIILRNENKHERSANWQQMNVTLKKIQENEQKICTENDLNIYKKT